ncbi:MAG: hypothetical protein PVF15_05315 [Candidatus Bathyarchaeota archaeon]
MFEIEQVVAVLKDGEWHELDEIGGKCTLSELEVESILGFLAEYGFIKTGGTGRKLKVDVSFKRFLEETQAVQS